VCRRHCEALVELDAERLSHFMDICVCGRHGEALVALDAERGRVVDVITLVAAVPLFEAARISSRCKELSRKC
jgi:hypothetical protein